MSVEGVCLEKAEQEEWALSFRCRHHFLRSVPNQLASLSVRCNWSDLVPREPIEYILTTHSHSHCPFAQGLSGLVLNL
jgi:hypothetical protein